MKQSKNYENLSELEKILDNFQNEAKTQNQVLSDLHLFLEILGDEIKSLKYLQIHSKSGTKEANQQLLDTIDFNSALMITNSGSSLIIQSLLDAIILKRYRFFFILCNILLNSEIDLKTKEQVKDLYKSLKYEIGYEYEIEDLPELYTLYLITRKLLHITLSDWDEGRIYVNKIIEELFLKKELGLSKKKIKY